MSKRLKNMKINTKFVLVVLLSMFVSLGIFAFLWCYKWEILEWSGDWSFAKLQVDEDEFWNELRDEAKTYDLPDSESDVAKTKALEPLFELADKYTSIYIYGEDGLYRAGKYATIMDESTGFRTFFDLGYRLTGGEGEDYREFEIEFKNETAQVVAVDYKRALYIYPFLLIAVLLCVLIFLGIVLFFVRRKMREVLTLEQEILLMASGDLTHPVPVYSNDEIGILARELNNLRISLNDNILREQESRKANQDLITALSHDLRTPLTILTGYLEVIKLQRNPQKQEEYLERCLKKTSDIKELTDQMFNYALVSEESEVPKMSWISTDYIMQCIHENCDFVELAGFSCRSEVADATGILLTDKTMIKRISTNLFSNILKYGDKGTEIKISGNMRNQKFEIQVENAIKKDRSDIGSNNIGLRNVQHMMHMMDGELILNTSENLFCIKLLFPLR